MPATKISDRQLATVVTLAAIGTAPNANGATIAAGVLTLQPASASLGGVLTNGQQIIGGTKLYNGAIGLGSIGTPDTTFFATSSGPASSGTALIQLVGSTSVGFRILERNSSAVNINDNESYATHLLGSESAIEGSSGVHPLFARMAIRPLDIINGAATTANAATLYIEGPAIGTAVIANNYAFWVDAGVSRLDGDLELQGIASATKPDILFYDSTTKKVTFGAAPAGGTGSGITRSIISIAAATTGAAAASVDYVYLANGTFVFTLPTAVSNTNRYTVKNIGTGTISIATTSAQTIDGGAAPITISRINNSLDFISNGTNWFLI